jgi:hypothetical protein
MRVEYCPNETIHEYMREQSTQARVRISAVNVCLKPNAASVSGISGLEELYMQRERLLILDPGPDVPSAALSVS